MTLRQRAAFIIVIVFIVLVVAARDTQPRYNPGGITCTSSAPQCGSLPPGTGITPSP